MTDSERWFWFSTFLVSLLFVYFLGSVLSPFITAALLAYVSNPIANMLVARKCPRTLAVVFVFLFFAFILAFIVLLIIPLLERQIRLLINTIPHILDWVQMVLLPWLQQRFKIETYFTLANVKTLVADNWKEAGGIIGHIIKTISTSGLALIAWSANLLIIPVVVFYLLRDWDLVVEKSRALLPRNIEPTVVMLVGECNEVLGSFFRGQLLVMLALGIIYSLGLWLTGLNLGLLIGIISGLVSIVPYLGFIVGIGAASIAAFFQFHDAWHLLGVWMAFGVGQTLESTVLTPNLVGDKIGLHPVAVIFAILAGGQLFGFVGVLLALPTAAVIMVLLRYIKKRYVASPIYQEVG